MGENILEFILNAINIPSCICNIISVHVCATSYFSQLSVIKK